MVISVCASYGEMNYMDYKKLIIELLDMADDRSLKLVYYYVKALLGLG